ncbi:MAG: hypothetical protein KKF44_01590 [Nanoarchaeota archaeon]|nr:hypothetical protein [Nanoarchaeota archaeon]
MKLFSRKKSSLSLSINAIVVLILAITMLGLGLGFMKNMFSNVSKNFGDVSAEVKKDMIQRIQDSGEKVVLNKYDIEMKQSSEEVIYVAINEEVAAAGASSLFTMALQAAAGAGSSNAGYQVGSGSVCMTEDQVSLIGGEQKIDAGEAEVFPVYIKTDANDKGTCKYTIIVSEGGAEYERGEFYVNVK